MSFRSPISKARGKGSAHSGLHHWVAVRMSAVALIPLTIWFVVFVMQLAGTGLEREAAVALIAQPCHTLGLLLFIVASFYHGALGLQEVWIDYVSGDVKKTLIIWISNIVCFAAAAAGVFAVLSIYFKG